MAVPVPAEPFRERVARLYARFVAFGVFFLLLAGAAVTSTGSGLAVPDWPLSYGQLMPPMVGGIFWEHGHRMVAVAMSTLVGIQVAMLLWARAPRRVRNLSLVAFGAILAQALLGGLTVIFLLPPAISSAHAGLAEIVFALTATIALLLARPAPQPCPPLRDAGAGRAARRALLLATGAIYVQILLGAVMRHTGAGLAIPDFPMSFGSVVPPAAALSQPGVAIHLAHRLGAIVVTGLAIAAAARLRALKADAPRVAKAATLWAFLLAFQILLGGASIWTGKAPAMTVAHFGVGALVFVTGVLLAVALSRRLAAAAPVDAPSAARQATPSVVGSPA